MNKDKEARKGKWRVLFDFGLPLTILMALTIVFRYTDLDLNLQKLFFLAERGWIYKETQPWLFLYQYGTWPTLGLALAALVVFLGSFMISSLQIYRKGALFLFLLMLLGPGLIINSILKKNWGRPRPNQLVVFSGHRDYLPVWKKGPDRQGRSFPSGHASMGFFLFSPFFIIRKRSKKWAIFFLSLGLGYGALMGLARMVQGGHFASDVIWAGGIVYLCGLILSYVLDSLFITYPERVVIGREELL